MYWMQPLKLIPIIGWHSPQKRSQSTLSIPGTFGHCAFWLLSRISPLVTAGDHIPQESIGTKTRPSQPMHETAGIELKSYNLPPSRFEAIITSAFANDDLRPATSCSIHHSKLNPKAQSNQLPPLSQFSIVIEKQISLYARAKSRDAGQLSFSKNRHPFACLGRSTTTSTPCIDIHGVFS